MNKRTLCRLISVLAALVMALSLLTGCGTKSTEQAQEQEDAQTIQVYLWTNALYETYAPYIQSQLPDVNIEFIVGHNDLDFYKFLQQNGGLPDIITCCRFSLHDAAPLDVYKRQIIYLANNIELSNEASRILNLIPDEKIRQIAAQKHTYSRLIYQRRNKIVHEFYDVKSPMNFVENQSEQLPHVILRHSFIDEEYTPEHWVLNIPEQFIVNVFHSAIEGYLMYCQQNQRSPFKSEVERSYLRSWYDK